VIEKIIEILNNADNILILTHIRPDGDTLGSAYGLKYALEGKNVKVFCPELPKERLMFLYEEDDKTFDPQLIIAVDAAELSLLGEINYPIDIKIDHHPNGSSYAKLNYIDPEASSCGEMIFKICKRLGKLNKKISEYLYAAINYDTGNFRYRNVTAETHRIAAELIDTGIDSAEIGNRLFGLKTQSELEVIRLAYDNLHYYNNGKIAVININADGDINAIPLDIQGVEIGITIRPDEPCKFRISMRSVEGIDVSAICARLGGGGHVKAAGAIIEADDPETAERIVMEALHG